MDNVLNIVAQEVKKGDLFNYEYGRNETLKHVPAPNSQRGEIEYFYAYANMKNGGFAFQVMHISEIEKIRDNYSISYKFDKAGSIWGKHFSEMALKTVIKRLIKYLPVSVEIRGCVSMTKHSKKDITGDTIIIDSVSEIIEAKGSSENE